MVAKAKRRGFLLVVMAVTVCNGGTIAFDSIAGGFNPGVSPVSILNVIRSVEELNAYCTAVNFDTALLATKPDLAEKSIIALISMSGGGNKAIYRHIQQIVDDGDTVFLEIRNETMQFDADIRIEAAYSFIMLSIPKTDKPITLREVPVISVVKPAVRKSETRYSDHQSHGIYDGQGRLITHKNWKYPCIVVFSRDFKEGKKLLLRNRLALH